MVFKKVYEKGTLSPCVIISEPDSKQTVLIVYGNITREEMKYCGSLRYRKPLKKFLTFEELTDKQKGEISKRENMFEEMNYIFHLIKEGSATNTDKERFKILEKELYQ